MDREPVRLIPLLREWIAQNYPGTKIAIGEWNWGPILTMNGAVGIADVLGIFGREGVDVATYWTSPPANSPGARAFAMYSDYDGAGGHFGDVAVAADSSSQDDVQAFASIDSSTRSVLIMLVNQRPDASLGINVELDGAYHPAAAYQLGGGSSIASRHLRRLRVSRQSRCHPSRSRYCAWSPISRAEIGLAAINQSSTEQELAAESGVPH